MKILLMGPQGCGKGTQGEMLSEELHLPLISVGQLLREVSNDSEFKSIINEYQARGDLVPQHIVADLLKERVTQEDCVNGFIFDGWGRNRVDLEHFDPDFDKVIFINISVETTISRLSSRRTCSVCGDVYNIITMPPKVDGICDECGGELIQRADDTPEAIRKRLDIFYNETCEVIDMFRKKGILIEIDGEKSPVEVFDSIKKSLNIY